MYACFFIGHRDAPQYIQNKLYDTVLHLVMDCHVTQFVVGHYGEFDRMATAVVQRVIREHPEKEIQAFVLEPYFPGDRELTVPHYFDDIWYPEGMETVPKRFCIEKANQKALDASDYLIAYVIRSGGSSAKLLSRAERQAKTGRLRVINLAEGFLIPNS